MKAALKTFFTWLITILCGSLILALFFSSDKNSWLYAPFGELLGLFALISGGCSIPGMILYHFFALYTYRIKYAAPVAVKLYLSFFAISITISSAIIASSFLLPSGTDVMLLFVIVPYAPPFIFSTWLFNYSNNVKSLQQAEERSGPALQDAARRQILAIPVLAAIPYIQSVVNLFTSHAYNPSLAVGIHIFYIVIIPVAVLLLLNRKKAGWIIMTYFALSALSNLYSLIQIIITNNFYGFSTSIVLFINLICNIIIGILLFKESTCRYLNIGRTMRILTFLISMCIIIISFFIFRTW